MNPTDAVLESNRAVAKSVAQLNELSEQLARQKQTVATLKRRLLDEQALYQDAQRRKATDNTVDVPAAKAAFDELKAIVQDAKDFQTGIEQAQAVERRTNTMLMSASLHATKDQLRNEAADHMPNAQNKLREALVEYSTWLHCKASNVCLDHEVRSQLIEGARLAGKDAAMDIQIKLQAAS